jgi:PhnB protein
MNTENPTIHPYLFFEGRCDEAIEFYKNAVGASVNMLMRNKDNPEPLRSEECGAIPPEKVMHAQLLFGNSVIMISDGRCSGNPSFEGFGLTLSAKDESDADRLFNGLSNGGAVVMPLAKTFFSPRFGMVTDKFGVCWMVMVPGR